MKKWIYIALGTTFLAVGILVWKNTTQCCASYEEALKRAFRLYCSEEVQNWDLSNKDSMTSPFEVGKLCYHLTGINYSPPQDYSHDEAKRKENETQSLLWATACGSPEIMRYLLRNHEPDAHVKGPNGWDLMTLAAYMNDNPECLRVLYEAGLGVNGEGSPVTPLREAAHQRRTKCMQFLLDHGANINQRCARAGETALDAALWCKEPRLDPHLQVDVCIPSDIAKTVIFLRQRGARLSIELDPQHGIPFPKEIIQVIDGDHGAIEKALEP